MQIIKKSVPNQLNYSFHGQFKPDELLFFDIETTGFSPDISSVYLIGCTYYKEGTWHLIQWFADDYCSEVPILHEFFQFIKYYKVLIHYNGTGFDLPYLTKKCIQYQLTYDFSQIQSLDLYKKLQPYKKLLSLENLKLKTVESFFGISRTDCYNGGELIQIYGTYINGKYMHNPELHIYLQRLTLHNEEDITGLLALSKILGFRDLFESEPNVTNLTVEDNKLFLNLKLLNPLPSPISFHKESLFLFANEHEATLSVELFLGELKFFYENYQDYFYLPTEDMAVHKSVALYVDKEHRTKAKASNCYCKKSGLFIPEFQCNLVPILRKEYKDKSSYVELNDDLLQNETNIKKYTKSILQYMLK